MSTFAGQEFAAIPMVDPNQPMTEVDLCLTEMQQPQSMPDMPFYLMRPEPGKFVIFNLHVD